ncbi:Mis12 protein-domain-containing protein [Paraphysoderma sedebokerense]|nr:Mis12 protein-domain-containing protein [Paraphysoderma sedebokerense]
MSESTSTSSTQPSHSTLPVSTVANAPPSQSQTSIYNDELIIEHFQSTPLSFIDDVINSVNDLLYQGSAELERFVEGEVGGLEAVQGIHMIETLLESAIDKNFDRFELFALQNVFKIPEGVKVLLPHYKELNLNFTLSEDASLDHELSRLRKRLVAVRHLNRTLKSEESRTDRQISVLKGWEEEVAMMKQVWDKSQVDPKTAMPNVTSSLQKLNDLFSSLQLRYPEFQNLKPRPSVSTVWVNQEIERHLKRKRERNEEVEPREEGKVTELRMEQEKELVLDTLKVLKGVGEAEDVKKLNDLIAQ